MTAKRELKRGPFPELKISVLTPAFNAEKYLHQLISSVQDQSYPEREHLIIDDGSSDDTLNVLEASKGIVILSRENRGQYSTQNELLNMATGEVVVFICADDYFAGPDVLATVAVEFARDPRVDIVVGRTPRMVEGDLPFVSHPDVPLWMGLRTVDSCLAIQHCSVFVRRTLLLDHGILFDPTFRTAGDWGWLMQVFAAARQVKSVPMDFGVWRMHPRQTSVVAREGARAEVQRLIDERDLSAMRHRILKLSYEGYGRIAHVCSLVDQHGVLAAWRRIRARARRVRAL